MKIAYLFLALLIANLSFAQNNKLPHFLEGTWKMENKEIYEQWDKLNENTWKGIGYEMKNGQMEISEYLDITIKNQQIIYTATTLHQNNGKATAFILQESKKDNLFIFENPNHDFPKEISYQIIAPNELLVKVSDGKQKGFSYTLKKQNIKDSSLANPNYDKELVEKLGADDYGMKNYFLVILKTGTNTTTDKAFINECFRGHLENINTLVADEKLIVAGPLVKNEKNYRGIFILNNITNMESATAILQTDPAIKNKLLDYEIFSWYGSAALPKYLPFADKIWKLKP